LFRAVLATLTDEDPRLRPILATHPERPTGKGILLYRTVRQAWQKGTKSSPTHRNTGAVALTGLSIGWVTQEACRQRETGGQISKPMPAKQAPESPFCRNNSIDTQNGQFAAAPAQDAVFS
jgi:hypothetical protein